MEGLQNTLKIELSRAHAYVVLPFSTAAMKADGVLLAQDIDPDGDIDLLWKSAPPIAPRYCLA
jgi:hypothetical protein